MLRITVSRIRVFFVVLGCAILSASLFDWAQNLRAAEAGICVGEGGCAERARGRDRGNMASGGKLRAPVFRQCGAAIETAARQSLRSGSGCRSRLGHSSARRRPPAGYGSKRRPVSSRQRRARWPRSRLRAKRTRCDAACAICRMVCQPLQAQGCGTRVGTTIGERCRSKRNGQRSHAPEFRRLRRPRHRTGRRARRFRSLPAWFGWVSADFPTIKSRRCEWIACSSFRSKGFLETPTISTKFGAGRSIMPRHSPSVWSSC